MDSDLKYVELTNCQSSITGVGLNEKVVMEQIDENFFLLRTGAVDVRVGRNKPKTVKLPMDRWDLELNRRNKWFACYEKGTTITVGTQEATINGTKYAPIPDTSVRELWVSLFEEANADVEEKIDTQKLQLLPASRIEVAASSLADLGNATSVADFNNKLRRHFSIIPRRIDNLSKHLAVTNQDFTHIIEQEAALYDNIVLALNQNKSPNIKQDYLQANRLTMRPATEEEREFVLKQMDNNNRKLVNNIWKFSNTKKKARFEETVKKHGWNEEDGTIMYLFHGSPTQNWASILTNELWIRPGLNGGAFGPGLYFAIQSDKSLGYTSFGYWRNSGKAKGYMALNRVAVGTPYFYQQDPNPHDMNREGMRRRGTDSLWAESATTLQQKDIVGLDPSHGLYRDEIIIYDDSQSMIEYLIELKK